MAISNRVGNTGTTGAAASTSLVITAPTSTAAGDYMQTTITVNNGSSCTITTLAGWTLLARTNNTTVLGQGIYYKIAGASEPSTYTWTITSEFATGVCNGYTGVDPNNPIAGFTALGKTTASTSATFGACIPQSETSYGVLCISGRNTTASTTLTTAGSYTIDGQVCTSATDFIVTAVADQHATYVLPLASVTPTSLTFSTTSTDIDTVVFLRPSLTTISTPATDVCTFANTLTSPVTSAKFGTGYAKEWIFAFVETDGGGTFSETCTVSGTTLTWTLVGRANSATVVAGSAEIWAAYASSALAFNSESVTVTPSTASSVVNVVIASFINCNGYGASITNEVASGTASQALTTTQANSWVWACLLNVTNATAPTLGASQTLVQDFLPSGEGEWVWRETSPTATPGSVTLSTTAPTAIDYAIVVVEIFFAKAPQKLSVISQAVNRAGTF
jgi:hypothetical protein